MSKTQTLDRIRQLRQDCIDAKAEIESRINEVSNRINQVCKSGVLPFDEAFTPWREAFEHYADEGKARLEKSFGDCARPNDPHPITGHTASRFGASYELQTRTNASGIVRDNGCVFAHLHRETIIEQARAWFESMCADCNVPPADERRDELQRLATQLRELEEERDDIEDELSELFASEQPSPRKQAAERKSEEQRGLDILNGPIEERNKRNTPPEPSPSPVTIRDGEGRNVDDPGHGPAVRRSA